MIKRTDYLEKLIGYKDKQIIKIVTGIRRCGKSTLLQMYQNYLLQHSVLPSQIIAVNFEDIDNAHLKDPLELYSYISSQLQPDRMNYVILDEIQMVENFPKVVDSLYIKKHVDIYITGSNAYLLSSEIATMLSGRYVEIKMLPLSFKEYTNSTGVEEISRKYNNYLQFSSFPFVMELGNDAVKVREYLDGLYNSVILKDVVAKNKIADVMMLESVIRFIFNNIGNLMSTKKIADTMTSAGRKISTHTVESYVTALVNSFIIYRAKRYDIKGKQYLKTNDKYYIVDLGLRSYLLGSKGGDVGHILENIVYLELIRRDYEVFVGKTGTAEVDFVAMKQGIPEYYQVSATVRDSDTLTRELKSLHEIADHYPKFLITMDDDPPVDHNGIQQINVKDFLLT